MKLGTIGKAKTNKATTGVVARFVNKVFAAIQHRKKKADKHDSVEQTVENLNISGADTAAEEAVETAEMVETAEVVETEESAELEETTESAQWVTEEEDSYYEEPLRAADNRYNALGLDCAGFSKAYYRVSINRLLDRACDAGRQMQDGNYRYAVFDSRAVAESAMKMLLRHNGLETGRMEEDIENCRLNGLITADMAGRLHGVRLLGNFNGHNMYAPDNLNHEKAFFSLMQALELISEIEIQLLWPEPLPELSAEWEKNPLTMENLMTEIKEEE